MRTMPIAPYFVTAALNGFASASALWLNAAVWLPAASALASDKIALRSIPKAGSDFAAGSASTSLSTRPGVSEDQIVANSNAGITAHKKT